MLVAALAAGLVATVAGLWYVRIILRDLPSPELTEHRAVAESTKIYDRTGQVLLYELHGEERRTVIPFEEIPEMVKRATLAIEDINFYAHPAFSWKSILRAVVVNLRRGGVAQGGSTITQQLVKNAFLSPERTFTRKIKELALAIRLEQRLSKDEILNLYLNQIPYGANAYGVEAASQLYFQKSVTSLSLAEAAALAALPKAPTYYSPWGGHRDQLLARKNLVLEKMREADWVSDRDVREAMQEPLAFSQPSSGIKAPHFVIAVQEYLNRHYGEEFVRSGGLNVITTLDAELQDLAERVVDEGAKRNEELYRGTNAALVAQDPKTGQILAMVGSRNYFDDAIDGKFNVATQGLRQPGSAIKPFVYATAFAKGYTPETVVFDLETEFDTTGDPKKSYKPQNFDETFRGPLTLREALGQSLNVPSVKTLYLAGLHEVIQYAKKFGITTFSDPERYGLSLVLGGGEVKLIDLVGAYSVLAEEGVRNPQTMILKITDRRGTVIEEYQQEQERVFPPEPIRVVNDILSDAKARMPLFRNSLSLTVFPGYQVALKTGTTNDFRDAWAIGYTPSFVTGVWAGNNNNEPMQRRGGSILAAVPIWNAFMKEALKRYPPETFEKPPRISSEKPFLNGEVVVTYASGGVVYPQIHDILFYVKKNDPQGSPPTNPEEDSQYKNWEAPIVEWVRGKFPNPDSYNRPLPPGSVIVAQESPLDERLLSLVLKSPRNGDFVTSFLPIDLEIRSGSELTRVQFFLNGNALRSPEGPFTKTLDVRSFVPIPREGLQHLFKIIVENQKGGREERELILYTRS